MTVGTRSKEHTLEAFGIEVTKGEFFPALSTNQGHHDTRKARTGKAIQQRSNWQCVEPIKDAKNMAKTIEAIVVMKRRGHTWSARDRDDENGVMMVVWRRRRRAVAQKQRIFTGKGMVKERKWPSMKGGVSLEMIVVEEAVMAVTWYVKEQIVWEIMGHHKQIASQPKWKLARPSSANMSSENNKE
jgi:uncharacterized protein (UPF0216 family)